MVTMYYTVNVPAGVPGGGRTPFPETFAGGMTLQTTFSPLRAAAPIAVAVVAACTAAPMPPPLPPPDADAASVDVLVGAYEGRLLIEGRPFRATMTLRRSGARTLTGSLVVVSPVEIDGSVEGVVVDGLLRLIVTYEGADGCGGTIAGILDVPTDSPTLAGPVTVHDCRGPVAGGLDFRR
jgi:hypothetical protein